MFFLSFYLCTSQTDVTHSVEMPIITLDVPFFFGSSCKNTFSFSYVTHSFPFFHSRDKSTQNHPLMTIMTHGVSLSHMLCFKCNLCFMPFFKKIYTKLSDIILCVCRWLIRTENVGFKKQWSVWNSVQDPLIRFWWWSKFEVLNSGRCMCLVTAIVIHGRKLTLSCYCKF